MRWPIAVAAAATLASCGRLSQQEIQHEQEREVFTTGTLASLDSVDVARDAIAGLDGNTWVLGSRAPFLFAYDSSGKLVQAGGRRGRGPADYLFPAALAHSRNDTAGSLWVVDLGRSAVLQPDSNLAAAKAVPARLVLGNMRADIVNLVHRLPSVAAVAGDTVLFVRVDRGVSSARDLTAQTVVRLIDAREEHLWSEQLDSSTNLRWLIGYPLWASCSDGSLVGVARRALHLLRISPSGRIDSAPIVRPARRIITLPDLERLYLAHLKAEYREAGLQLPAPADLTARARQLARRAGLKGTDSLPALRSMRCLTGGQVLAELTPESDEGSQTHASWLVLTTQGSHQVLLPKGFEPLARFEEGFRGLLIDSLGQASLAVVHRRTKVVATAAPRDSH